jgi:hypothetical protein
MRGTAMGIAAHAKAIIYYVNSVYKIEAVITDRGLIIEAITKFRFVPAQYSTDLSDKDSPLSPSAKVSMMNANVQIVVSSLTRIVAHNATIHPDEPTGVEYKLHKYLRQYYSYLSHEPLVHELPINLTVLMNMPKLDKQMPATYKLFDAYRFIEEHDSSKHLQAVYDNSEKIVKHWFEF